MTNGHEWTVASNDRREGRVWLQTNVITSLYTITNTRNGLLYGRRRRQGVGKSTRHVDKPKADI